MAAAEARTAWQRAANRYFVQEDAKRAPKLACCQSSNSLSKQSESGATSASDGSDHCAVGFMPSNRNPSCSNLPPDANWWLHMQPNYENQRGSNLERSDPRKADVETSPPVTVTCPQVGEIAAMSEESIRSVEFEDIESFLNVKKAPENELKFEELDVVNKVDQDSLDLKNMTDYYEFLEMEMAGGSISNRTSEFSSSADASWVDGQKVPWWRVTDGEELASFVAQKSLQHIENCDLPPLQKRHVRRDTYKQPKSVEHDEILMSSIDWEAQNDAMCSPSSGGLQRRHWSSVKDGLSEHVNAATVSLRPSTKDVPEKKETMPVGDPSKAKLLEALCHSQTRAREAEKAAKQAYNEKEHLLKLFFKQASQLFAYKQWFKLLQLETLQLQGDESESSPSTTVPHIFPWSLYTARKLRKNWQKPAKAKRRKRGSDGNDIGKYAVAFAVGFTLVGAGLILGWTVGWLLPAF